MIRKVFAVAGLAVLASSAYATTDAEFGRSMSPVFHAAADGRYKIAERKAKQALDLLKDLRNYSGEVKDASDKLRDRMHDNHYDDWINTKLSPVLFETRSLNETIKKTYDLEKGNVSSGLSAAKAGDFGPVEAAIARINSFEADYEAREKAVEARVNGVRAEYEHHFGNANLALSQFSKLALIQELLGAKPQLVKKIELQPASVRPIRWSIVLEKKQRDSNDPRFGQIPRTMSIQDGAETVSYPVVVR